MKRFLSTAVALLVLLAASFASAQSSPKEKARELYGLGNARFDAGVGP